MAGFCAPVCGLNAARRYDRNQMTVSGGCLIGQAIRSGPPERAIVAAILYHD
jgi:hypothetical protein